MHARSIFIFCLSIARFNPIFFASVKMCHLKSVCHGIYIAQIGGFEITFLKKKQKKMADRFTGLEYILGGGAIIDFPENRLPTTRDVLRLYSQYWKINLSDSVKEKAVASKLKQLYESQNLNAMSTFGIITKIKKKVVELKRVLKFKTKTKTDTNIRIENSFRESLNRIFDVTEIIEQPIERNCTSPVDIDDEEDFLGMFRLEQIFSQL